VRVLLDENMDRRIKRFFKEEHEIITVQERGWAGKKNGELLRLAQDDFDVFVTTDRNIPHQQSIASFDLTVVILEATSNAIEDLTPLMARVNAALEHPEPGAASRISDR
jgi:predicted nuclease of predicted toxin-antitoxin system